MKRQLRVVSMKRGCKRDKLIEALVALYKSSSAPLDDDPARRAAAAGENGGRAPGADSLAAAIAARPEREWRRALAVPFLDSAASPSLTRALYVPWLSARKNRWADYVLYERR